MESKSTYEQAQGKLIFCYGCDMDRWGRPSKGTRSRWRAVRGEGGTWRPSQGERLRLHSDWVSNLTLSEARDRFSLFSVLAMPIQKKCLIRDDRDKLPHRLHPPVDQIYS